jgi:3-hydroxymyristoyl/3-hydroxydecanoyl-(acyl carrier protein) dehydratase
MEDRIDSVRQNLNQLLREQAERSSEMHSLFLAHRRAGLQQVASLLEMQLGEIPGPLPAPPSPAQSQGPQPLFTTAQMAEFATGSMAKCFGPEFAPFEHRRHPRIPNGDLMLMSRAVEIKGLKHQLNKPASIVTEFDVPADAWFFRENSSPVIPYSVWMEMALQPCGFLSAYLGTMLLFPEIDFYFRNLDGSATLLSNQDVRGKTITCQAKLLSTLASGGTIIQRFTFELTCAGQPLFEGWSVFGFFTPEAMANQAGLDGGKSTRPELETADGTARGVLSIDLQALAQQCADKPAYRLPSGRLNFLDQVLWSSQPASQPRDLLLGIRENQPGAWFYPCHFHQDPVMPGSLGVEAILQAIQAYALAANLGGGMRSPAFCLPLSQPFSWKYRGQILPTHRQMKLEVQITRVEQSASQVVIAGDASLWADSIRIYEVKNAAVCLVES